MAEGHRGRLIDEIMAAGGLHKVSENRALEFLLSLVFPRIRTDDIGTKLLKSFGSLNNVLDAQWQAIALVSGMGERSAKKLKLLRSLVDAYLNADQFARHKFEYINDLVDYAYSLLHHKKEEHAYFIGLDIGNNVTITKELGEGNLNSVKFDFSDVMKCACDCKPVSVVLAHNHPSGKAIASNNDITATDKIKTMLELMGINLIDHIVVGENGIYSMHNRKYYREF